MSTKTLRWLLLSVLIILFVSGCDCTDEQIEAMQLTGVSPADGAIVPKDTTISWSKNATCNPGKYHLQTIFNIHDPNESTYFPEGDATSHDVSVHGPGWRYTWTVAAQSEDGSVSSQPSVEREFYVGPLCSGQTLTAPKLRVPDDSDFISQAGPADFNWVYYQSPCLPQYSDYQFSTDPTFITNVIDSGTTPDHRTQIFKEFPNCSTLYWRVRANDGTNTGPWSEVFSFHTVLDNSCWQVHYQSEDTGRIHVQLYEDVCYQTGLQTPFNVKLQQGCVIDKSGKVVHADGQMTSLDHEMWEYTAQLGSGPCPSSGLDQKYIREKLQNQAYFYVVTPGTYCVSVSRSQTADNQGTTIGLVKGVWTEPRTNDIVAYKTIEMGPGYADAEARFGWDRIDKIFLTFPLEKVKKCYFGPEPNCPVIEFTDAGSAIPIFTRDEKSEWVFTEVNGSPCYIQLEPSLLEKFEIEVDEDGFKFADLEVFPQPAPCPKPEPIPPGRVNCAAITDESQCLNNPSCDWVFGAGPVQCVNK